MVLRHSHIKRSEHNRGRVDGFSLIELIIYVAIFSVISAVFVAVLIQLSVGESLSKQQVY